MKNFTNILLAFVLAIIVLLIVLTSCNFDGSVGTYADNYNAWLESLSDTTPEPPIPLVIDTCEELFFLQDTEYVMLITEIGVTGWFYGNQIFGAPTVPLTELLDSLLPQMSYEYYEENGMVSVVMEGPNLHGVSWIKFGSHDPIGQRITLNPFYNSLAPMGSMTYDEYAAESKHRLNTNYFSLLNCNFTPDQNNSIARINIHPEVCKHGGDYASYHSADGMLQSVIDSTELFLWERIRLLRLEKLLKS